MSTKLLLIEDDSFKEQAVSELLSSQFSFDEIICERAVQTAIARISQDSFELILLDMALPSHDRSKGIGSPTSMPSGGIEVLLELNRLRRQDPVIIVTQYPEVEIWGELVKLSQVISRLKEEVDVNLAGLVHFDQTRSEWKAELIARLEHLR